MKKETIRYLKIAYAKSDSQSTSIINGRDRTGSSQIVKTRQSAKSTEDIESTETTESTESIESIESTESMKNTSGTTRTDSIKRTIDLPHHSGMTHGFGFLSGELLSEQLGVSRAAVWKTVKQLQQDGYQIESRRNVGYRLLASPDKLYEWEVFGDSDVPVGKYCHFEELDSTNLYARVLAQSEFANETVIVAESQTMGRGRLGRQWFSPKGKSIYISFLLKPDMVINDAVLLTLVAACSTARAIREVCAIAPLIKWPNDVVIDGKKICGILTEVSGEPEQLASVIVGIGINVNLDEDDFMPEVKETATSLKIVTGTEVCRKALTGALIRHFLADYRNFVDYRNVVQKPDSTAQGESFEDMMSFYRENCANIGRRLYIMKNDEQIQAEGVDITQEGHLVVRKDDGTLQEVISGEVSIRGIYGYL